MNVLGFSLDSTTCSSCTRARPSDTAAAAAAMVSLLLLLQLLLPMTKMMNKKKNVVIKVMGYMRCCCCSSSFFPVCLSSSWPHRRLICVVAISSLCARLYVCLYEDEDEGSSKKECRHPGLRVLRDDDVSPSSPSSISVYLLLRLGHLICVVAIP